MKLDLFDVKRWLALWMLALGGISAAHADDLKPFQVSYTWVWHGATVALSTLTFSHDSGDTWSYASSSEPRGIGHLYPLHPTLRSTMQVDGTDVKPLTYHADAGSSSSSRNADVKFDWSANHASGTYEDATVDLTLKPGVQDDLSVQIAMLVQLQHGDTPSNLSMIDKNSIRDYTYKREGEETITTALGPIDTVVYASRHTGSPRTTRFWCAPSKGYLPVKVEQKRIDDVEWTMEIQSLKQN